MKRLLLVILFLAARMLAALPIVGTASFVDEKGNGT